MEKLTPTEMIQYYARYCTKIKASSDGWHIASCPFHEDKRQSFQFHSGSGAWQCFSGCGSGNFPDFKKRIGDWTLSPVINTKMPINKTIPRLYSVPDEALIKKYNVELLGNKPAMEFILNQKGITEDDILRWKIGLKDGKAFVTPHYKDGKCVNAEFKIYFADGKKKMWRWEGCESILFNQDIITPETKKVTIVEGALDAISAVKMGFENVVAVTVPSSFKPDWVNKLVDVDQIDLIYDNDNFNEQSGKQAGKSHATKALQMLGEDRCRIIFPPLNDLTDCYLAKMTAQDVIDKGEVIDFTCDNIMHITELADRLKIMLTDFDYLNGIPFPEELAKLGEIAKMRHGELEIISGFTSHGKTAFTTQLAEHFGFSGNACLYVSFEMSSAQIARKVYQMSTLKNFFSDTTQKDIDIATERIKNCELFLLKNDVSLDLEQIKVAIRTARRRYGIRIVIIDNLDYLFTAGPNEATRIGDVCRELRQIATTSNMCIILIAHTNKELKEGMEPMLNDIKGSSGIMQTADVIIFVYRDKEPGSNLGKITVRKNREDGDTGEICTKFTKEKQKYEYDPHKEINRPDRLHGENNKQYKLASGITEQKYDNLLEF